jgi:signal transduction histidine kinase
MLMAAFVVLASNRPSAIYLLASYSMLFSAIFLALLFQLDFIPHNRFLDYSVPFAIILEAIILSIGLSEKVTKLRIENESAERQRRIIQEELSQQLIQTRERERAGISKLLHDSVNHELVVVRKNVSQLIVEDAFQSPTLRSKLTAITDMLHKVINEIRDISHLAHPHIVKHLGLETALKAMLERTFDSSFIWNLYIDKVELDYDTQLFLYRAVQESTTNILKHANASECLVRLAHDRSEHRIVFTLKDDGDGFDSSPYNWRFGLRTLNEHCKSVAGKLNIHSVTGEGTTLTILLPIKHGEIANG